MNFNKIDDAVLALLYLGYWREGPHELARSWKTLDWDAMARLYEKDLISDPARKAKSVALSEDGLRKAQAAFEKLFGSGTFGED